MLPLLQSSAVRQFSPVRAMNRTVRRRSVAVHWSLSSMKLSVGQVLSLSVLWRGHNCTVRRGTWWVYGANLLHLSHIWNVYKRWKTELWHTVLFYQLHSCYVLTPTYQFNQLLRFKNSSRTLWMWIIVRVFHSMDIEAMLSALKPDLIIYWK